MMSGIKRSAAQSPPPITFPARTEATPVASRPLMLLKKDCLYAAVTSSAAALLLEYGSTPPRPIGFTKRAPVFAVFVTFVCRDDHDSLHAGYPAHILQNMCGPKTLVA